MKERRRRTDVAAMIILPIVANLALAAVVFADVSRIPMSPQAPVPVDPIPLEPLPTGAGALPVDSVSELVSSVERASGDRYTCEGPWAASGRRLKWACRTPDTLVVIEASGTGRVDLVEATWFGFDARLSSLPVWGAAAQRQEQLGVMTASWIGDRAGSADTSTFGPLTVRLGGARGALTLAIWA
jgi:hypothetical protein